MSPSDAGAQVLTHLGANIKRHDRSAREVRVRGRELRLIARHHAATGIFVMEPGFERTCPSTTSKGVRGEVIGMQRCNRRSANIVFSAEFVGAGHAGNARMLTRHPKTVEAEVDGDGVMRGPAVTVMNSSIFDVTSVSGSSTGPIRRTEKQSAPRYVPHSSRTSHGDGCGRSPVPRVSPSPGLGFSFCCAHKSGVEFCGIEFEVFLAWG